MAIVLVGANGLLGSAVIEAMRQRGHTVITAGRTAGGVRVDIAGPVSVSKLFDQVGAADAVACAAGVVPYARIQELTADDFIAAYTGKVRGQIDWYARASARSHQMGPSP